jgi:hypothetical protein
MADGLRDSPSGHERLDHFIRLWLKRLTGIPELPGILAERHRLIDDTAR